MYAYAEHKNWNVALPYIVFAYKTYKTAVRETTWMTPFRLIDGRKAMTTLNAMLANVTKEDSLDVVTYLQRAEEAWRLVWPCIKGKQQTVTKTYADGIRNRNRVMPIRHCRFAHLFIGIITSQPKRVSLGSLPSPLRNNIRILDVVFVSIRDKFRSST